MFTKRNKHVRKYTIGRVSPKKINFFYVVPVARSKKGIKLAIVDTRGDTETKITLSGRDVLQLRRVLAKGSELMNTP
jgi:hypothetical protein